MDTHTPQLQHLYLRAGFGASPSWIAQHKDRPRKAMVEELFQRSRRIQPLTHIKDPLKGKPGKKISAFKLGLLFLTSRGQLRKLNLHWMDQMAESQAQLREKMTLFWHDHFATHTPIAWLMQVQNNTLRQHALGRFEDLVQAIAKDPAMLLYLNNQQNKKDAPNENFAREVMELFTLGEGAYTEKDIKEAARAFTGWTVNRSSQFEFKREEHDFGEKEFMGQKGNFNGEDIIRIILQQKQCARFLTEKICQYFVHEQTQHLPIETLTEDFYQSGYDISRLMRNIFEADWFYDPVNRGSLIKSPVELIVQLKRLFQLDFRKNKLPLMGQDAMGQVLFFPPNVSGWPHGQQWIDSTTLLFRMRMPLVIFGIDDFDITVKPEYERTGMAAKAQKMPKFLKAQIDWGPLLNAFEKVPKSELPRAILSSLIQCPHDHIQDDLLMAFADTDSQEDLIKSLIIRTLALPEFQLG